MTDLKFFLICLASGFVVGTAVSWLAYFSLSASLKDQP